MSALAPSRLPRKSWNGICLLFLGLLPLLAIFHTVMWFGYTRTLFRPETAGSKRTGYLVGLEDCRDRLEARDPQPAFPLVNLADPKVTTGPRLAYFGDSFSAELSKACSRQWHEPLGSMTMNWSQKNGLSQIMTWIRSGWFRDHGVKVILVERIESDWLDTFADIGDSTLDLPLEKVRAAGGIPNPYEKAVPWTFANNGNFKVIIDNLAYHFSPTAFDLTDTCLVPLNRDFFHCSYPRLLVFYRGDIIHGVANAPKNGPRFERALVNLKALSDLCHEQGLAFYLVVPPGKSTLYRPWVIKPFYPESKTLEMLRERGTPYGYVDLALPLQEQLKHGAMDFYYPDDLHWTYAAATIAAQVLTKAGAGPR